MPPTRCSSTHPACRTGLIEDLDEKRGCGADDKAARAAGFGGRPPVACQGRGAPVAGLHVPSEMLAVLSDENLAELERGIDRDGRIPYEILAHLEADPTVAGRLMGWLTSEARAITNRTVVTNGESWFEFLVLSSLEPGALAASLQVLDPDRHCVKQVRRLTDIPAGELVLGPWRRRRLERRPERHDAPECGDQSDPRARRYRRYVSRRYRRIAGDDRHADASDPRRRLPRDDGPRPRVSSISCRATCATNSSPRSRISAIATAACWKPRNRSRVC